jgi:thiol-disulfide isomerase/thioredoxin
MQPYLIPIIPKDCPVKHLLRRLLCLLALAIPVAGTAARAAQQAPEFDGITHWINSPPLRLAQLHGKVVLIDFWAYSCINCIRTFAHVNHLYDSYKNQGLVVVGVHTPEFDFEKDQANVADAVKRFGIHYPVAMDDDMATWNAWNNQYWPAEYLIDQQGNVVAHHYGEGNYLDMENAIRGLLKLPALTSEPALGPVTDFSQIGSPEMYFGSDRQQYLASPQSGRNGTREFTAPETLQLNQFALLGRWKIADQTAQLVGDSGEIRLHFQAGKLNIVASAAQPVPLQISVDGKPQAPVTVQASRLYTLFDSHDSRDHVVSIRVAQPGLTMFTFTFG